MARKTKQKKGKPAIALVVDGKNEKWYISKVKEHYPCSALRSAKIKPDLPGHKKIQELFDCTKTKLDKEYNFVILIIDLDEPLKKPEELNKFKELYSKYIGIIRQTKEKIQMDESNSYYYQQPLFRVLVSVALQKDD